jgi:hypothetical protein
MNAQKSLSRFNAILDVWEQGLNAYSEAEFTRKPAEDAWSIGQVYMHLIGSAQNFHLKQVAQCIDDQSNANASKTMPGRITYLIGGFLPIKIKVPPSPAYTPPQAQGIAEVRAKLSALRPLLAAAAAGIEAYGNRPTGKTKHPAFGYLNAGEWFHLIAMHFRHHLRQKSRIDAFLKNGK